MNPLQNIECTHFWCYKQCNHRCKTNIPAQLPIDHANATLCAPYQSAPTRRGRIQNKRRECWGSCAQSRDIMYRRVPKFSPYSSVFTSASLPTSHSHCKQCSALTSPALHARGCARPSRARGGHKNIIFFKWVQN